MPPNARIDLDQLLKFCNQSSTRGCGGCNPLEGTDCYVSKYTKITLFARISQCVFVTLQHIHPFVCPEMAGEGLQPPSPPKSTTDI